MDLLAANDQENRVAVLRSAAGAKQLGQSQGLKGLGSKTPAHTSKAPKTPFKVALNDDNVTAKAGAKSAFNPAKAALLNSGVGGKKAGAHVDPNAFVTPAGPRMRAPLGAKTTNAKTKAFQTPAPPSGSAKPLQRSSPRLQRPKVKVQLPEPAEDEVPEVEYMPPKEIPLPDKEDNQGVDTEFPMLRGANFTRGMAQVYLNPVDDDGLSRYEREWTKQRIKDAKQLDDDLDKVLSESMAKQDAEALRYLGLAPPRKAPSATPKPSKGGPKPRAPLSTLQSKAAAAALPPPRKPNAAQPKALAKLKTPSSSFIPSKKKTAPAIDPSTTRQAAAMMASRSTIGYSHGRSASASLRKPLSHVTNPPAGSTVAPISKPTATAPASRVPSRFGIVSHAHSAAPKRGGASRGPSSRPASASATKTPSLPSSGADPTRAPFEETEEDVLRKARLRLLQREEDGPEEDEWARHFESELAGGFGVDGADELDDFELALPAAL